MSKHWMRVSDIARFLRIHRNHARDLTALYRLRRSPIRRVPVYDAADVLLKLLGLPRHRLTPAAVEQIISEPLLTTAEVAVLLGVHHATVRRYVADGRLPYVRFGSRGLRFVPSDLRGI